MRLTYLDILEQCFHDKFRGYNKQEVDTFLHLVADDFKSLDEELKEKNRHIELKTAQTQELQQSLDDLSQQEPRIAPEVEEEMQALRNELAEKNQLIAEMKNRAEVKTNGNNPFSQLTPEILKEKAKKIIFTARQHAQEHKDVATKELGTLQRDIQNLQEQKQQLMDNIRATALEHINKFKTGTQKSNAGNSVQD
jgi:DivIVA domain-containing protein